MCSLYFEKLHFYSGKVTIWDLLGGCEIPTIYTKYMNIIRTSYITGTDMEQRIIYILGLDIYLLGPQFFL